MRSPARTGIAPIAAPRPRSTRPTLESCAADDWRRPEPGGRPAARAGWDSVAQRPRPRPGTTRTRLADSSRPMDERSSDHANSILGVAIVPGGRRAGVPGRWRGLFASAHPPVTHDVPSRYRPNGSNRGNHERHGTGVGTPGAPTQETAWPGSDILVGSRRSNVSVVILCVEHSALDVRILDMARHPHPLTPLRSGRVKFEGMGHCRRRIDVGRAAGQTWRAPDAGGGNAGADDASSGSYRAGTG